MNFNINFQFLNSTTAKTIQERLNGTKESVSFENAALYTRQCGEGKSAAISKLANSLIPSIRSHIVFALIEKA